MKLIIMIPTFSFASVFKSVLDNTDYFKGVAECFDPTGQYKISGPANLSCDGNQDALKANVEATRKRGEQNEKND